MTLSAEFSVNGDPDVQAHSVAYGATVSLAALSTEFRTIAWEIMSGSKSGETAPTIALSGAPTGVTASFAQVAAPVDGLGRAWVVKCTQTDSQGNASVAYRVVGTLNTAGRMPICADEGPWRDAVFGWSQEFNEVLAAIGSVGTGDFVGPAGATSGHLVSFSSGTGKAGADSGISAADVIKRTGGVPFTGNQSLGGNKLTNSADAASAGDLPPLSQVQTLIAAAIAGAAGGGGDGFVYTLAASTVDSDPSAGNLRLNNATIASVTQIFIDLQDADGNDTTGWLDRIDDAFGTAKGYIRVGSRSDRTKWILYKATGLTTTTGYRKIPVTYVSQGAGGAPSTSASDVFFSFESLGFEGTVSAAQGGTGIAGAGGTNNRILRTADGSTWAAAQLALATDVSGTLPFANGGTGLTTATIGQLFYYDGTKLKAFGPTGVAYTADANVSKALSDGKRWLLDDLGLTTGRNFTWTNATGAAEGKVVSFICKAGGSSHYTIVFSTGSLLVDVDMTVSVRYSASFGWELAGWE